jgi:hypothetical protein
VIKKYFFFLIVIILISGCFSTKNLNKVNSYNGKIVSADLDLNFFAQYDSLKNIRFRLYYLTGIKVADFTLMKDSLRFQYLIDDSYKGSFINFYNNYNNRICLYNVTNDLFTGNLFLTDSVNSVCYNREFLNDDKKIVALNIFTRTYEKIASISCSKFSNLKGQKIPLLFDVSLANKKCYTISLTAK